LKFNGIYFKSNKYLKGRLIIMSRIETKIITGWEFTLKEPEDKNFKPVNLPHDWAITAPEKVRLNREWHKALERWGNKTA
jgi:hypothetical protein